MTSGGSDGVAALSACIGIVPSTTVSDLTGRVFTLEVFLAASYLVFGVTGEAKENESIAAVASSTLVSEDLDFDF
jgi:hypothetical protein